MGGDRKAAVTVLSAFSTTQMSWKALVFMDKVSLMHPKEKEIVLAVGVRGLETSMLKLSYINAPHERKSLFHFACLRKHYFSRKSSFIRVL